MRSRGKATLNCLPYGEGLPRPEGLAEGEGLPPAFFVRPGHSLVRLWPDAVRAIYGSDEALPGGGGDADKRHLDLTAGDGAFQAEALPLAAIYVIADRRKDLDTPVVITPLKGHEALMALVARTYMNYVLDADLRVRALTVFARLAAQVPIRQPSPVTIRSHSTPSPTRSSQISAHAGSPEGLPYASPASRCSQPTTRTSRSP